MILNCAWLGLIVAVMQEEIGDLCGVGGGLCYVFNCLMACVCFCGCRMSRTMQLLLVVAIACIFVVAVQADLSGLEVTPKRRLLVVGSQEEATNADPTSMFMVVRNPLHLRRLQQFLGL